MTDIAQTLNRLDRERLTPRPLTGPGCRRVLIALLLSAGPVAAAPINLPLPPPLANASVEVYFSPRSDTDVAIADAIGAARRRVWIAGYYFTSTPIAKALHEAHARHVDVRVVLDRSQATLKYSSATYFYNEGVPVKINARYPVCTTSSSLSTRTSWASGR